MYHPVNNFKDHSTLCSLFPFQTFHLLAKMMLDERKVSYQSQKMEQVHDDEHISSKVDHLAGHDKYR